MKFLIWAPAVMGLAIWSLFSWLAYKLVDWIAGALASGVGAILGGWAAWLLNAMGDVGQVAVVVVWAIGSWLIIRPARLLTGR